MSPCFHGVYSLVVDTDKQSGTMQSYIFHDLEKAFLYLNRWLISHHSELLAYLYSSLPLVSEFLLP